MQLPFLQKTASRTIGLITDFGLADPYVGQMRAVLAAHAPACSVIDISHGVEPFDCAQGAFFLAASAPYFPHDAVFLAVVDPGVGSDRRSIAVQRGEQLFVGPDNGMLDLVAHGDTTRAYDISCVQDRASQSPATFHGRDVFAPVVAWLASGGQPETIGTEIAVDSLVRPTWAMTKISGNSARVHIMHVDHFGNCIVNMRPEERPFPQGAFLRTSFGQHLPFVRTYADLPIGAAGFLEGSQGFFEIAINQGSAAQLFHLNLGDVVELEWKT